MTEHEQTFMNTDDGRGELNHRLSVSFVSLTPPRGQDAPLHVPSIQRGHLHVMMKVLHTLFVDALA